MSHCSNISHKKRKELRGFKQHSLTSTETEYINNLKPQHMKKKRFKKMLSVQMHPISLKGGWGWGHNGKCYRGQKRTTPPP